MPDETPKRAIPRLRPKQRDLTQLDPHSLTAALYHRELLAQLGRPCPIRLPAPHRPTWQPVTPQRPRQQSWARQPLTCQPAPIHT